MITTTDNSYYQTHVIISIFIIIIIIIIAVIIATVTARQQCKLADIITTLCGLLFLLLVCQSNTSPLCNSTTVTHNSSLLVQQLVLSVCLSPSPSPSLSILTAIFPGEPGLAHFIEAKDDGGGGDNWSYRSCKAPFKSSPPTSQHQTFYRPDALPVTQPTVSKH